MGTVPDYAIMNSPYLCDTLVTILCANGQRQITLYCRVYNTRRAVCTGIIYGMYS
jgi:hypothetical protein